MCGALGFRIVEENPAVHGEKGEPSYSKTVAPEARPDTSQCHIIQPQVVK